MSYLNNGKFDEIVAWIEAKNKIKLSVVQRQILKCIIRGDSIFIPRGVGRTTLYEGYASYLVEVDSMQTEGDCRDPELYDSIFMINDIVQFDGNEVHHHLMPKSDEVNEFAQSNFKKRRIEYYKQSQPALLASKVKKDPIQLNVSDMYPEKMFENKPITTLNSEIAEKTPLIMKEEKTR